MIRQNAYKPVSTRKRLGATLVVWLLAAHLLYAQQIMLTLPKQEDTKCKQWVEETLSRMSSKEKAGQLLVYTLNPKFDKTTQRQVQQLVGKYAIGGLLYSTGTLQDQAKLTNLAQSQSEIPLLITFGGECGLATCLANTPVFPINSALGCISDNELMEAYGREVARELRELGVQVHLAPVADAAGDVKNPVIRVRPYSEDPDRAADKALAYSRGLEAGGVMAGCVQLSAQEPVEALKGGADMMLVQNNLETSYKEVLKAIKSGELSQAEVDAKCRKILACKYLSGLVTRSQVAVKGLEKRINAPAAQELARKLRFSAVTVLGNYFQVLPLDAGEPVAILSLGEKDSDKPFLNRFNSRAQAALFRVTRHTPETERNELAGKLRNYKRVVISVTLRDWEARDYRGFLDSLNLSAPVVYALFTPYRAMYPLESALQKSSAVVLAHSREADVQERVADVLFAQAETQGKLAFSLGNTFRVGEGDEVKPAREGRLQPEDYGMKGYLLHQVDALMQTGLSEGAYPGCRLLVLKNGETLYSRCYGTYSDTDLRPVTPASIYDLSGVSKSAGTTLAVMKLYDAGRLKLTDKASQYLPWLRNTNKKEITIRELLLCESGLLPHIRFFREAIDDATVTGPFTQGFVDKWHYTRMGQYTYACSDFKYKRGLFTPRKDATHALQVADGMWLANSFKQTILKSIASSETRSKQFVVSEIDYILLQQVVEAIVGKPMNEFLTTEFYTPMGLTHTLYLPLQRYGKSDIVPTAANDYLRRQDVCGYVLDEAAAFMGGVAGNAGLFSTAEEVAAIFQMLLNGGEWQGRRYLSEATCRLFITEKSQKGHYGLGFDKPNRVDPKASTCAASAPDTMFGQTGSTGTCVWADPATGLVYVFLSNRVCPHVWNSTLNDLKLRRKIQEVICQSTQ